MPNFDSLTALNKYLREQCEEILKDEVADIVKEYEVEAIKTAVYDYYKPKHDYNSYERRGDADGLADTYNMKSYITQKGKKLTLFIANETPPNEDYPSFIDDSLAELIEYGDGYNGLKYYFTSRKPEEDIYKEPRPFTELTIEYLKGSNAHVNALKQGLLSRGINVTNMK